MGFLSVQPPCPNYVRGRAGTLMPLVVVPRHLTPGRQSCLAVVDPTLRTSALVAGRVPTHGTLELLYEAHQSRTRSAGRLSSPGSRDISLAVAGADWNR